MRRLQKDTTLFTSPALVYIDGVIELGGSFKDGLLVNYSSGPRAENDWQIGCLIPEQKDHDAIGFEYKPPKKKKSDPSGDVFLDLGGQAFLKERERDLKIAEMARSAAARPTWTSTPASRAEVAAKRAADQARIAAAKKRRAALDTTIAEMQKSKSP